MRQVVTFVCAVMVVGDVVLAAPVALEVAYEGPPSAIDVDGAEIIETTGEAAP
jgi:hypothetical protein